MSAMSPNSEGLRLIFRRPAIVFAEIAWRWSFAAATWFLGVMFLFEYADSLPVNSVERLMLGTQQPFLFLRAIQRIFHGSAFRFTEAGVLLAISLVLAWIVLASLGSAVTVRAVIEELGIAVSDTNERRVVFRPLLALNFLRAAVALPASLVPFSLPVSSSGSCIWAHSSWRPEQPSQSWAPPT